MSFKVRPAGVAAISRFTIKTKKITYQEVFENCLNPRFNILTSLNLTVQPFLIGLCLDRFFSLC
jgi:hypothetical protein